MPHADRNYFAAVSLNAAALGGVKSAINADLVLVLLYPFLSYDCKRRAAFHSLDHVVHIVHEEQS